MKTAWKTTVLFFALAASWLRADSTWVYTVQLNAAVTPTPPTITIRWEPDEFGANGYTVYRKAPGDGDWGAGTSLPGTARAFRDTNVEPGETYEYQVVKAGTRGYTGYGYICAGINAAPLERRGKIVLVVDNSVAGPLAKELARLRRDMIGDGWSVIRRDVPRNASPATVKQAIRSVYQADPANVQAVFLFGHVPIYRSGNLNVDGHQARPMPADTFYADMDGAWDNPSHLPSDVELMVGRVDFANMPGNGWPSEVELLRNYLNKDHRWRHKQVTVPRTALVGDRFGDFNGEAFAASGYRNFPPLVGWKDIHIANEQDNAPAERRWSSMLAAGTYLWAYGCGGGSYTSMSGLGTHGPYGDVWSADLVGQDAKAVFVMMMGSWLGEWDSKDNIMRAMLATPSLGLTCSWAGRPHWFYHHMAMGQPIGYSARLTMNNNGLYRSQENHHARGVHIALMGDPTLRLHQVAPPANVTGRRTGGKATLSWTASPDQPLGYVVYRSASPNGPFRRVSGLLKGTSFTDPAAAPLTSTYMVRAMKQERTPSGTYFNPSQGVMLKVTR